MVSVVALVGISAILLDPAHGADMSAVAALRRCGFWCLSGLFFAAFVCFQLGSEEALSWLIGYTLEYALSFDNLFLFHIVFSSYGTPRGQVYRGIVTAMRLGICVRFALFFVSAEAFNLTFIFRWVFGAILMYSGVKVITVDEDEGNPTENCLVKLVTRYLPVHHEYADGGAFFVCHEGCEEVQVPAVPRTAAAKFLMFGRGCKATPLLLAVITLMIIDMVFAVDSVTAKVSMVSQYDDRIDFFLNFTSTAFAMLCMPSLYFVIVLMVHIFRFLKYGLGGILILIGLKLVASEHIHIREDVSCLLLLSILGLSMLASLLASDDEPETSTPEADRAKVHELSEHLRSEAAV